MKTRKTCIIALLCASLMPAFGQKAVPVSFSGESPNILDFFKAVRPYEKESMVEAAYLFIVEGKPSNVEGKHVFDTKKVDYANGYIYYFTAGAPGSSLECCYWNCADKQHKIFAINLLGESPWLQPTYYLAFYRYTNETKQMVKIDPPFTLKKPEGREWNYKLPEKGKDIMVNILADDYEVPERTITLKWNGDGFDVK